MRRILLVLGLVSCRAAPQGTEHTANVVIPRAPPATSEAPAVSAPSAPREALPPLRALLSEAWNRHGPGNGASNAYAHVDVTVERLAGGRSRIEHEGVRKSGALDPRWGLHEDRTRWREVWLGTWAAKDAGTLVFEVRRAEHVCDHTVTERDVEGPKEPCSASPDTMTLECRREKIPMGGSFLATDAQKTPHEVWRCAARGGVAVAWVLGESSCVETRTGPGPMAHRACAEAEPEEP